MNTDKIKKEFLYKELTSEIINSAFEVHNVLGCGLLEKIYENSLIVELQLRRKQITQQQAFQVLYKKEDVGSYYSDIIVDGKVIVEVKTVEKIDNVHRAQVLNYLRISGMRVGLIINFAKPKLVYERLVV